MTETASDNYKGVWDGKVGFGEKPALLVIDFMKGYVTPGSPLYAPGVVEAVWHAARLLNALRQRGMLIVHTNIRYYAPDFADGGTWLKKAPVMKNMVDGNPDAEFCTEVTPVPGELVITKQYASAFFGTSLAATLTANRVDTVILVGCSTSGCIRATAVDATQHGFRTIVVREGVGDRHSAPHEANLFDINSKYGDVVLSADVMARYCF